MRTLNSIKNIVTGLSGRCLTMILEFVSRTIFIYILGVEYLGVTGLFTNILSFLNISELGIGTAIVYSLYKPLVQKDIKIIQATMNLLRKAYFYIGFVIALIGLLLIPFLPYIIKSTNDLVNINLIYLLYLFQSVSSYWFFAYKSSILHADQKNYIVNLINYMITTVKVLVQIILLLVFKSFILYVLVGVVSDLAKNVFIAKKVDKLYPFLREENQERLLKKDKTPIYKNLFGLSMYKISGTVLNSTDNIIISSFINIATVGLYSNYLLITNAIVGMMNLFFSSFTASIGNLNAIESTEKKEAVFRCLNFLDFWLYGFCAICFWILFNPFITLWIGPEYVFRDLTVAVIIVNFLTAGLHNSVIIYKDACGLFWEGRYRPLASALLNIIISLVLVQSLGIVGVLLGTILSRFLTTWWFDPWMVHRYVFNKSVGRYYFRYFRSLAIIVIVAVLIEFVCLPLSENTWRNLVIKFIVCLIVPNTMFLVLFRKSKEFRYIMDTVKPLVSFFVQKTKRA